MRILAISPIVKSPHQISCYSDIYAYYIQRELRRREIHVEILPREADVSRSPIEEFDHLIGFGQKYFDKHLQAKTQALRKRVRGAIAQFADTPRQQSVADLNLVPMLGQKIKQGIKMTKYCVIGWAADPEICRPEQSSDDLRILLDHPDYEPKRLDLTEDFLEQIKVMKESKEWTTRFRSVEVDALTSPKKGKGLAKIFPFDVICKKYRDAHVFMVTHKESVGLSVIEAATAGCLVLAPRGFIDTDLLSTVRHIEFDGAIPWKDVFEKINPTASRAQAVQQTWRAVADRVIEGLAGFRR